MVQLESRVARQKKGTKKSGVNALSWIGLITAAIATLVIMDLMSSNPITNRLLGVSTIDSHIENYIFLGALLLLILGFFLSDAKTDYASLKLFKISIVAAIAIHLMFFTGFLLFMSGLVPVIESLSVSARIIEGVHQGLSNGGTMLGLGFALLGFYFPLRKGMLKKSAENISIHAALLTERLEAMHQELDSISADYHNLSDRKQDLDERINHIEEEIQQLKMWISLGVDK